MSSAICPFCETAIKTNNRPRIGHRMRCPSCDEELVVINVGPVHFSPSPDAVLTGKSVDRSKEKLRKKRGDRGRSKPRSSDVELTDSEDDWWEEEKRGWLKRRPRIWRKKRPQARDNRRRGRDDWRMNWR
jgi:hypothetical protein